MEELDYIRDQIVAIADPTFIYLFGSQAKGTARPESDIDLCIVARTSHKRRLFTELHPCQVFGDLPLSGRLQKGLERRLHGHRRDARHGARHPRHLAALYLYHGAARH